MKFKYIFIVFLILLFSQCFSFVGWNPTLGGQITKTTLLGLLVYCLVNLNRVPKTSMMPFVTLLMILPFISIFGSYSIHGQSVAEGFRVTMFTLSYLFFFILYILKIDSRVILKMCLVFGLFWTSMEAIQQITYPAIWFATRHDTFDKAIEIRNGIYRYNIEGREFGLILLFYCFQKYLEKPKRTFLIGIVIGLAGIYLLATRQIMVASVLSILYALFATHKLKGPQLVGILIIVSLIYFNMDTLFGDYIEMTKNEEEDNIRLVSYNYFGLEYNQGQLLPAIIGNGISGTSAYGHEIDKLQDFGLFCADIGIVGMYSWYGILYVLTVLAFFVFCAKNSRNIDLYLRMYVLYMLVTSVMLHHFGYSTHHIMTLCIILYLIDDSIKKNKFPSVTKVIS